MSDSLFLQLDDNALRVKLAPVVIFSILDHYIRRQDGQKRVIGSLLGTVKDGVVEIVNCFPVPHLEKAEEVAVGKDFNRQMMALHRQVNTAEKVVGWYATAVDRQGRGVMVTEQSCLIHDFYGTECQQPVHLVVDTTLTNNKLSVEAYLSSPLTMGQTAVAAQFQQIPVDMSPSVAARVGLDTMISAQLGPADQTVAGIGETKLSEPAMLRSDMENLERAAERLLQMLQLTCDYVDDVVQAKRPKNAQIGRKIAEAMAAVPRINPGMFEDMFNNSVQDLLTVSYLSSLIKTQVVAAERLNCARDGF